MNQNIFLVAGREIRQTLSLKSFWLMLLLLPAALVLTQFITRTLTEDESTRVSVVDRSGSGAGEAVQRAFTDQADRDMLRTLSRYVQRHSLEAADPDAPWAQHDRWYTSADIEAYRRAGGLDDALERIDRVKPDGIPEFDPPSADFAIVDTPASLAGAQRDDFGDQARALFDADSDDNPEIIVRIPEAYPADPRIDVFSGDQTQSSFIAPLQEVLTADLRTRLLAERGIAGADAVAIQTAAPAISVDTPPPGGGAREAMFVRSIVPIAMSYILMMSLFVSASWMLQGSVEERSNKLLESLLACIRPEDLMYGKLLGSLAVGFFMIFFWAACAGFGAFATQGAIADMIRPALEPLSSPGIVFAILYFFLAGYVMVSILFVAIGSMVDSMSEANGYLTPILLGIMLPITLLLQAVLMGNDGIVVKAITWFPLWTPFAVLARLGSGIEVWELVGTGVLLAATIALEIYFIGRLFRASLLATGQKPTLKRVLERFRAAPQQ